MTILIAYGTVEGQTKKVAKHIERLLRESGQDVILFDTSGQAQGPSLEGVEQIILAASVHERRHPEDFETFLYSHRSELVDKRCLLLSISLKAAFEDGQEEAQAYVDEMMMRVGLTSSETHLVAGAIRSASYDFYASQVLRHVVLDGQNFDPNARDHEFTDWDALDEAVRSFLKV